MNNNNLLSLSVFVSWWLNYNCHQGSKAQRRIHKVYELVRLNISISTQPNVFKKHLEKVTANIWKMKKIALLVFTLMLLFSCNKKDDGEDGIKQGN